MSDLTAKPFEAWDWNDLLTYACWEIIRGITSGRDLRTTMHSVVNMACTWERERLAKEAKAKKEKKA